MSEQRYLTVSALVRYIKNQLESDDHLKTIYLRGEISNFTRHSSGHLYFSLKDERSQIKAIMFANSADRLNFSPKKGDKVLVFGSINVYEPNGDFSILVKTMELDGIGELYLAYEKLKKDLEEKGYFKEEYKKAIPKYPNAIGVVTSPTGAAIEDIINTIGRRYPLAKLYVYPALVQGENAKYSIKQQIEKANKDKIVDVLIVGRGGGSIEDLWAFNELVVAEAIFNSEIPIISAVGHETDTTIADFVSDLRAPTPTGAAELATPNVNTLYEIVKNNERMLNRNIKNIIAAKEYLLVHLDQRLINQKPTNVMKEIEKRLDKNVYDLRRNFKLMIEHKKFLLESKINLLRRVDLNNLYETKLTNLNESKKDLTNNFNQVINNKQQQLNLVIGLLKYQNPLQLMSQGYTVTLKEGKRLSSVEEVNKDDNIETVVKDGKIISQVIKKEKRTWKIKHLKVL